MNTQPEKNPEIIRSMFSSVAQNYDKANSVLSLGIHHLWRSQLVRMSEVKSGHSVLDCATGTGDLAIAFKQAVGFSGEVIGTDFCEEMLSHAPLKSKKLNLEIKYQVADVMNLSFADNTFDMVSISFGIRNVLDPVKAIAEMARVVKPGGRVMVLEFGQMQNPILNSIYNFYSEKILPKIGGWVTGQSKAYEYLQTSSASFPCREDFVSLMNKTEKFSSVEFKELSFGIAYIYKATVR